MYIYVKEEYQQDATIYMIYCQFKVLIIDYSLDIFRAFYAHHQEKRPRVTAYGVYLLVVLDVAGCGSVVLRCRV